MDTINVNNLDWSKFNPAVDVIQGYEVTVTAQAPWKSWDNGTWHGVYNIYNGEYQTRGYREQGLKNVYPEFDVLLAGKLLYNGLSLTTNAVNSNAAKGGTTVLGHYPQYVKVAETIGARTFQIPTKIWNKMTPAQQWGANQKFLDRMILRGDNIRLATPLNQVKPGSFYQKELNYLFDKGYKVSSDGLWLVK